jgi:TRAP transporter TAXI family solute receptor
MNVTAQTTGGSVENVRLINKKDVELALAQSDTTMFPEIVQIVVRADGPIKTFPDLKGKKVGVGAPGSGTEASYRQTLEAYGMKKEDVNSQYLSFAESAEAFKDKHIDGFYVIAGIPVSAIMDVSMQNEVRILPLSADISTKLIQKYPFLAAAKIPANTYRGQTEDVPTVAVNSVLVAGNQLKPEVVYNLIKVLFENQPQLAAAHAKGKELNPQRAVTGVSIPFHPGAVKYYQEKGLMK